MTVLVYPFGNAKVIYLSDNELFSFNGIALGNDSAIYLAELHDFSDYLLNPESSIVKIDNETILRYDLSNFENKVIIYPIPANNYINVLISEPIEQSTLKIYNLNGLLVKNINLSSQSNKISIKDVAPGIYYFNLIINNNNYSKKCIIF